MNDVQAQSKGLKKKWDKNSAIFSIIDFRVGYSFSNFFKLVTMRELRWSLISQNDR